MEAYRSLLPLMNGFDQLDRTPVIGVVTNVINAFSTGLTDAHVIKWSITSGVIQLIMVEWTAFELLTNATSCTDLILNASAVMFLAEVDDLAVGLALNGALARAGVNVDKE